METRTARIAGYAKYTPLPSLLAGIVGASSRRFDWLFGRRRALPGCGAKVQRMTNLTRIFVSVFAGSVFVGFVLLLLAVFGPLLFPMSLTNTKGEDRLVSLMMVSFPVSFLVGAALGWRITRRWARE